MPLQLNRAVKLAEPKTGTKTNIILIVLLVLAVLAYIGTTILVKRLTDARNNPWIIEGVREAKSPMVLSQDPSADGSVPILRSVNEDEGIEFSYSFWMIIRDWRYKYGEWKHVFHKGNNTSWPNRAPGVWLGKTENTMRVYMNVHNKVDEFVDVNDIPMNKWVHTVVTVRGHFLDVYINGELIKRHELSGIPKQNFNNLYVTGFGGFGGFIGRFRYFNKALDGEEIFDESRNVPSMSTIQIRTDEPPYLSYRWREDA
tara:strand:+ start:1035 stop:1805 length:771 start_codon:yes stop_codon:yes gene_type:complete